jgi:hypothetical protein
MGAWTEIADYTVPSTTTEVVLSNLGTITKDDYIKVVVTHVNGSSSDQTLIIRPDSATGNNHALVLNADGTSITANNAVTTIQVCRTLGNKTSSAIAYYKLTENDKFVGYATSNFANDSTLGFRFAVGTQIAQTTTSYTSLLFGGTSNVVGAGTRIQIYRLDAEKVADITTTSNETQVNITGLNITKDSEYLLISDIENNSTTTTNSINLMVNGDTTFQNYSRQSMVAIGTTASADFGNNARYAFISPSARSLVQTSIKLTESGYYSSQSLGIDDIASTSVNLKNYNVTSNATNLTSITQVNVVSPLIANGIKSGSRFILYKLK